MHLVTKILVVAAVILSVILAALTMAFSVNASRITADHARMVQLVETTNQSATAQVSAARATVAEASLRAQDQQNALDRKDAQVRDLQLENSALKSDLQNARANEEGIKNQIGQLGETVRTLTALIESYKTETTQLRDNELASRREAIELTDRINDLSSQRDVLEQTVRALREQITEMALALEDKATGRATETALTVPGPPIQGRVVRTVNDPGTNRLLAEIDLGTNDQVRVNTRLHLARGSTFLGYLTIEKADLDASVGRVEFRNGATELRAGDVVWTKF